MHMKAIVTLILLMYVSGTPLIAQLPAPMAKRLLLTDVYIIDVEKGNTTKTTTNILINNGRIEAIGKNIEDGTAQEIKCAGQYILPGLWDMHAHPDDPELWRMQPDASSRDLLIPQFILHGVTGIRDMAGSLEVAKSWKARIQSGELLGPEIFAAGPLIDGPNPMWDGSVGIDGIEQVKPVVDSLIKAGVDFLKIYSLLPPDIFYAVADYANTINFPFVGHVPFKVKTTKAAEVGMKSQEHLLEMLLECSSAEKAIIQGTADFERSDNRLQDYVNKHQYIIDTYDSEKAARIFEVFVQQNTWHTPTISMWYKNAYYEEELLKDSLLLQYLPAYLRRYWTPEVNDHLRYRYPNMLALKRNTVAMQRRLIKELYAAGVKMLAGTDVGANPLCFPGIGIHNELELLVEAGLPAAEALRTATIYPAQFLEIEQDFGSIVVGKKADLVVLKKNPLEGMQHIRSITAVIKNGALIDEAMRENLLLKIAKRLN